LLKRFCWKIAKGLEPPLALTLLIAHLLRLS
jgi:hypothetical protein